MTVAELIEKLKEMPQESFVIMRMTPDESYIDIDIFLEPKR